MSETNESAAAVATAVSRAGFEEMPPTAVAPASEVSNLDLILDVTVPVTVSIGSVRKTISEILALAPGQVIELDRAAGDPVDLYVNDRLVARGEVVVVGDRYGFRVTEITAPQDGRPR
jgi:flagellar motor switch protein FliN/FliY